MGCVCAVWGVLYEQGVCLVYVWYLHVLYVCSLW